jgi:hypothetical protein
VSHVSVSSLPYQCRALLESHLWTLSLDMGRLPVHRTARRVACYWSLSPSAFALGKLMSSSFAALLHVRLLRDSALRRWPSRQPTTAEALFRQTVPWHFHRLAPANPRMLRLPGINGGIPKCWLTLSGTCELPSCRSFLRYMTRDSFTRVTVLWLGCN